jgi:tripartite-type tricarboxylate transporter receptor subunit TctC
LLAASAAAAQDYPNRVIKMLHGFPPGGNVDLTARVMAEEMSRGLGQAIVVEAKPGMAGSVAAEMITRTDPDGYTLMLVASAHAVTGAMSKNVKYKPVDDFDWISTVSFYPFVLLVKKDSKIQSLRDLLDAARARPGGVTYGSAGVGSVHHMIGELLTTSAQVKLVHVPYRGEAPALTGLLTGDIEFMAATTTLAVERVKSGEVRAIAVTGATRWKDLPDVPTVAEAVPGFDVVSWSGILTRAGTPAPVLKKLQAEIERVLKVPAVRTRLESFGVEVRGTSPAEMRALVERQIGMWSKLSKDANIQLE